MMLDYDKPLFLAILFCLFCFYLGMITGEQLSTTKQEVLKELCNKNKAYEFCEVVEVVKVREK